MVEYKKHYKIKRLNNIFLSPKKLSMKKLVKVLLFSALLLPVLGYGQQIKEGTIKVGKEEKAGFIATSKHDHSMVEEAMSGKLADAGLKKYKKKKKFYCYKEVSLADISPTKIDLCYKVQKKKHKSRIYLVVSKGYDNYVTSASDATTAANINSFLTQIDAVVEHNEEVKRKELEVKQMNDNIEQQKAAVKKAEEEKNKQSKALESMKQTR